MKNPFSKPIHLYDPVDVVRITMRGVAVWLCLHDPSPEQTMYCTQGGAVLNFSGNVTNSRIYVHYDIRSCTHEVFHLLEFVGQSTNTAFYLDATDGASVREYGADVLGKFDLSELAALVDTLAQQRERVFNGSPVVDPEFVQTTFSLS